MIVQGQHSKGQDLSNKRTSIDKFPRGNCLFVLKDLQYGRLTNDQIAWNLTKP